MPRSALLLALVSFAVPGAASDRTSLVAGTETADDVCATGSDGYAELPSMFASVLRLDGATSTTVGSGCLGLISAGERVFCATENFGRGSPSYAVIQSTNDADTRLEWQAGSTTGDWDELQWLPARTFALAIVTHWHIDATASWRTPQLVSTETFVWGGAAPVAVPNWTMRMMQAGTSFMSDGGGLVLIDTAQDDGLGHATVHVGRFWRDGFVDRTVGASPGGAETIWGFGPDLLRFTEGALVRVSASADMTLANVRVSRRGVSLDDGTRSVFGVGDASGEQLWITDGTSEGTKALTTRPLASDPWSDGTRFFFLLADGPHANVLHVLEPGATTIAAVTLEDGSQVSSVVGVDRSGNALVLRIARSDGGVDFVVLDGTRRFRISPSLALTSVRRAAWAGDKLYVLASARDGTGVSVVEPGATPPISDEPDTADADEDPPEPADLDRAEHETPPDTTPQPHGCAGIPANAPALVALAFVCRDRRGVRMRTRDARRTTQV